MDYTSEMDYASEDALSDDGPLQVLLIEDNPGDARLFEEYLEEGPAEVLFQHEGSLEEGVGVLRESRPDVLVTDLGLPDSEGVETVKAAAAAAPEVPIVVLTGQDDMQAALESQKAGATEYLQKGELTPALIGRTLRWALQRHRMQAKLRQRDAWIRSITEGLSAGVFRTGPTGRIEYANEALAEMLGAEQAEQLVGQDLTTFYADPTDRGRMLAEEGSTEVEVEFEEQGGSTFFGLLSAEAAYDAEGKPLHYDGVITDITDRVRREKRLRTLSKAVEQAKESILITDAGPTDKAGPRIEYVNSAFEEMTGYSGEEILSKTPRVLQGPETEQEVLDSLREALEAGEEWEGETVNYRKDGTPYRVQWNLAPVRGEKGEIEHWVSVQRDVTEEREREERLRLLARGLQQVGDKVIITGQEGQIEYVNEAFEEITGYSEDEVLGKPPKVLQSGVHDEAFYEELWETIQAGETFRAEFTNERKDGTRYIEDEQISPITNEEEKVTHFVSAGRDVTERKRKEEALREERDRRTALFENASDPIMEVRFEDEIPIIVDVNPAFEVTFGIGDEEVPGISVSEAVVPESKQEGHKRIRDRVLRGERIETEVRRETVQGLRDFILRVIPMDVEGTSGGAYAWYTDITERKERKQRLERTTDLLRLTSELTDVGGWTVETTGSRPYRAEWTDNLYNLFGLSPENDPPTEGVFQYYHPDDRDRHKEAVFRAEDEREEWDQELRLITEEGDMRWVRNIGQPVVENGDVVEIRGAIQDITHRKEWEEELRETKRLLEKTLESLNEVVLVVDPGEREIVACNSAVKKIFGYEPEELVGRSTEVLHVSQEAYERFGNVGEPELEEHGHFDTEYQMRRKDGQVIDTENVVTPLEGDEWPDGVVSVIRDITDRKKREQQLKEAKEEAERMNQLKSAFLANMSHEIRTPLTSILGFAEAIAEEVGGAGEASEVHLSMLAQFSSLIERSGRRLMDTLTSVLNLSKLQAGEMSLDLESVDLAAEAKEAAEEFSPQAREAGVTVTVQADEAWAWADEGGLQIALRNLLSNAIKYTEEGGEVWVRTRQEENIAALEVEDTGIGMDPENAQGLFEAFKQASEGVDREYEGTGLGLTVTKEVLDQMGGSIEVETEKGEGSRFTVRLPVGKDEVGGE